MELNDPQRAEKAVISCVMLEPALLDDQCAKIAAEDFSNPNLANLWRSIRALHVDGKKPDLNLLQGVVADELLIEVAEWVATTVNVSHHVDLVLAESNRRKMVAAAQRILEMCNEEIAPDELIDRAEAAILDVGKSRDQTAGPVHIQEAVIPALEAIERAANRAQGGAVTGIPTGIEDFDKMTGGLQPGELVVIGARPSQGKTALAMNIAEYAAEFHAKRSLLFSLEMTTSAITQRMIASRAGVDSKQIRLGWVSVADHNRMLKAGEEIERLSIYIDDSGTLRPSEIKARTRREYSKHGLDLVIVDYLQLVRPDGRRDRKDLEIADASAALKAIAKELNIAVIALSQLNRGPEQRDPDKRRPMMADIRESGAVEQDADVVAFIFRPHVYDDKADPREAEIIVAKQRNGPTGKIAVDFNPSLARFSQRPPKVLAETNTDYTPPEFE